jgi:lysophospholipase L1-like esterase
MLCAVSACSLSSGDSAPASSSQGSPSSPAKPLTYVALGDSYTSAPLVPVTDVAKFCFRSNHNYPSVAARELGATLTDVSCGGARTVDLRANQHPDVPPQLAALNANVDLVTIGIGGNDEGLFQQLVTKCPQLRAKDPGGAPCQAAMTAGSGDALLKILKRTGVALTKSLLEVHRLAPKAEVLVVGYPQIVAVGSGCTQLPLAGGDYAYAAKVNLALTEMVKLAAEASRSTYVDVYSVSKGHDICSEDPWINGSVNDQQRAAAYHPFAVEQKAVADLVVSAARD